MTKTGVDNWLAPEIIEGGQPYTEKVDIWSAGCVLYFMVTGQMPFEHANVAKLHQKIMKAEVDYEKLSGNEKLKQLILMMLQVNPEERFTAAQAL